MAKLAITKSDSRAIKEELKSHASILGGFTALLWVIQIINAVIFNGGLTSLGIHPRSLSGLVGILFAPFLHGGFGHLIANTVPLLVLGWFVMLRKTRDFFVVSVLSALVGGLGIWLIGAASSVHIGASILIFGYLGHLLFRGIFERRFWPILGSIAVFFLYGGALFGVLPGQEGISWQGHLFGLLGGILAARILRRPAESPEVPEHTSPVRFAAPSPEPRPLGRVVPSEEDDADIEADLERLRRMRG